MKAIVKGKEVELTGWFPPEVKPVRLGWYHTGVCDHNPNKTKVASLYNWWWDGAAWRYDQSGGLVEKQNRWWRGLAKPWGES